MAAPSGRRPLGQGFIRMIPVKVPVQSTGPEADLEVGAENAQPPEQSRQRAKRAHNVRHECQRRRLDVKTRKYLGISKLPKSTLPFTQVTGGKRADSGVQKMPLTFNLLKKMEREMGLEPTTSSLGK